MDGNPHDSNISPTFFDHHFFTVVYITQNLNNDFEKRACIVIGGKIDRRCPRSPLPMEQMSP